MSAAPEIVEHEYEDLGDVSYGVNMLAGALAGIAEHAVMYPVDSVKTRMQVYSTQPAAIYTGMGEALSRIATTEGSMRLWRGVNSVVLGAGPAHAVYFGAYEAAKESFGGNVQQHLWVPTAAAGAVATTASDALMNPFDVVKQRLQMHGATTTTVWETFTTVYRAEGLRAFYVSYPTTLAINVPLKAAEFSIYEFCKKYLNPSNEYSPKTHVISGGIAGALSAAVTTPLDVAKTLLQTQGSSEDAEIRRARGFVDAARIISQRDGAKGFFRGMVPRMTAIAPSTAICWACYELFKTTFGAK